MKLFLYILLLFPLAIMAQSKMESPFGNLPTISKKEFSILKEAFTDAQQTQQLLEEAVANGRDNPAITFNLGNAYYRNAQYAKAVAAYEMALSKLPNFFAARKNLGYALVNLNDEESARANFAKALALSGNSDVDILLWLASYFAKQSNWSGALACVEQALLHAPTRRDANFAKALYLFNIGRYKESESVCISLLNSKFPDANALRLLGKSRAKLGDVVGSLAAFSMIDSSDAHYKNIRLLCADILFSEKAYRQAAKIYLEFGENSKTIRAAEALLAAQKYADSLALLTKLPPSYENDKTAAFANLGLGNLNDAKKLFSSCLDRNPYDSKVCFALAKLLVDEGDFVYAKILYKRAQSDKSYSVASQLALLEIAVKEGAVEDAISLASSIYAQTKKPELADYIQYLKNAKRFK